MDQLSNCTQINITTLKMANLIDAVSSAACFTILLLFLSLLVVYKAYKTALQRILLYLTIATALDAMTITFNIELHFNTDSKFKFCAWIGFLDAWTSTMIRLFSFAFTVYLTTTVYQTLKEQKLRCLDICQKYPVLTEAVCTFAIIFLPLSYLWVPALHHTYGLASTLCYIKLFNVDKGCSHVQHSKSDYTTLLLIDTSLHAIVSLSFTILVIIISVSLIKIRRSKKERLVSVGRAIFLVMVIGTTLCIRTAQIGESISLNFFNATKNDYLVKIFGTPVYAITNLLIPLGFGAYLYSSNRLIKSLFQKRGCCKRNHTHGCRKRINNIDDDDGLVSVRSSVRQDAPSYTTAISPCYTNQFTDITENVSMSSPKYGTM